MAAYNISRAVAELLDQHKDSPPSFAIQLYPEHWTLNGGPKFLYNNQVASLLDDLRAQRIPTDFLELFDTAGLPFYNGCMIVQLLDYRPPKGKDPLLEQPVCSHVVLNPNGESLWQDICLLNQKLGHAWTDQEALELEAKILMATSPPLCLEPDVRLTRVANHLLRVSVPGTPLSLKRKAAAMEQEEEESEKARRIKIMQYMNPRVSRSTAPSYRVLEIVEKIRRQRAQLANQSSESALPGSTPVAPPKFGAPQAPLASPGPPTAASPSTAPTPVPPAAPAPTAATDSNVNGVQRSSTPTVAPKPAPTPVPAAPSSVNVSMAAPANGPTSTPTPIPAVPPNAARYQTPRPPSATPQPAIPPHMQQMYAVPAARTSNTPPPAVQRPPSTVANGAASSPVQRPATAQPPQQTPRQVAAALPRQPQQQTAASPQRQHMQPQPPAAPQMPQQPAQPQQTQVQLNSATANAFLQQATAQINAIKKRGLPDHIARAQIMQIQQRMAQVQQAVQSGRMSTPTQAQQTGPSSTAQGLQPPSQQQQQQARNSPRGAPATPSLAAQQQQAIQQQQQQQQQPQQQPQQQQQVQQQPQQPQQQHSFTYPMGQAQNHFSVAQHTATGQNLRPVIHGQHAMMAHQFQAGVQQQAQQSQDQTQHQAQGQQQQQQQHTQSQNQTQLQMQMQMMAQYGYPYTQMQMQQMQMNMQGVQGMQGRVPQASYPWPRHMQMAGHQLPMPNAAANAQAGKPAGT